MSSLREKLDQAGEISSHSMKNTTMIAVETRRADRLCKHVEDLQVSKEAKVQKLDDLQRLLSALHDQTVQLEEDIRTGEQVGSCFKMRTSLAGDDDKCGVRENGDLRKRRVDAKQEAACEYRRRIRRLVEAPSHEALEAESGGGLLLEYMKACSSIFALTQQAKAAQQIQSNGDETCELVRHIHLALLKHTAADGENPRPGQVVGAKLEAACARSKPP